MSPDEGQDARKGVRSGSVERREGGGDVRNEASGWIGSGGIKRNGPDE